MRRIAAFVLLCVFGALLPSATVLALAAPQQLVPVCCRARGAHSCVMGLAGGASSDGASSDAAPTLRQPACPYGQSLRAVVTGSISADITARARFGLVFLSLDQRLIEDAIASRVLRRFAPRGPPYSFSV
jgi:hypothetical protein